jgi:hypothetical protein
MASGKIAVQYAEVTGEDPRLLAVFPESPFMRATDIEELHDQVPAALNAIYGTSDFSVEYREVDLNRLPLAAPARAALKNAVLRGGPRDGLRVWHAVPHALLMSFDGTVHIWRYTQETESTADGDLLSSAGSRVSPGQPCQDTSRPAAGNP